MKNLYLVPVADEWLDRFQETVETPVPVSEVSSLDFSPETTSVRIWAAVEGSRNEGFVKSMESGDWMLFYNSGRYFAAGQTEEWYESLDIGTELWKNPKSRYLFTIRNFQRISIPRRKFNSRTDYNDEFAPQGLLKVSNEAIEKLRTHYESIEDLIEELDTSTITTEPEYLIRLAEQLIENYEEGVGPFRTSKMPEKVAIEGINDPADRALFLTLSVAIDFNRNARTHWRKCRELWNEHRWVFDPEQVVEERDLSELEGIFREIGMRYGKSDAEYWYQNADTLYQQYDSDPVRLLSEHDFDAPTILNAVRRSPDFMGLGGGTVGPLWIRLLHEDVHELERVGDVEIPASDNTVTATNAILGASYSSEQVKEFWNQFSSNYGIDPVKIDQPLWLIGSNWDDWGAEYIHEQLEEADARSDPAREHPSILFPAGSEPTSERQEPRTLSPIIRETEEIESEISEEIVSYEFDHEALRQATERHEAALHQFSRILESGGFECFETVNSDLLAVDDDSVVLSEVKSLTAQNQRAQIRKALGQLLEYHYFDVELRSEWETKDLYRCLFFDQGPDADLQGYLRFLESEGIFILWLEGDELSGLDESISQLQLLL